MVGLEGMAGAYRREDVQRRYEFYTACTLFLHLMTLNMTDVVGWSKLRCVGGVGLLRIPRLCCCLFHLEGWDFTKKFGARCFVALVDSNFSVIYVFFCEFFVKWIALRC